MVRSSSGFKVSVEVGVILCLTAGPNRRALGYCSSYRSIQSAANIKGEGGGSQGVVAEKRRGIRREIT